MATLVCATFVSGAPHRIGWLIALVLVAIVASVGRPQAIGPMQFSVSAIVQIAAIPLVGPLGAALVSVVPAFADRNAAVKRVFNASQRVLLVLGGSLAYYGVGGRVLHDGLGGLSPLELATAMIAATVAASLINAGLLAGVIQQSSAGSFGVILRDLLPQVLASYANSAIAAYLLVILWSPAGLGWISALFFLPSIVVIQWGLRQHAFEWATRQRVLTPFVRSLELRRPGSMEESDVGAAAAKAIALGLGLSPSTVDDVSTAARLRDVGYLALEGAPEAIARRDHALLARSVLGPVSFLDQALDMMEAHHERIDGHGYPTGLTGREISIGAKAVAVADTYARLMSSGVDRATAVSRCEARAGSGLDAECVAALRRALERDQLSKAGP